MTFQKLVDALRAGFQVYDKHPDGYLVRKEIPTPGGRRWILALALGDPCPGVEGDGLAGLPADLEPPPKAARRPSIYQDVV